MRFGVSTSTAWRLLQLFALSSLLPGFCSWWLHRPGYRSGRESMSRYCALESDGSHLPYCLWYSRVRLCAEPGQAPGYGRGQSECLHRSPRSSGCLLSPGEDDIPQIQLGIALEPIVRRCPNRTGFPDAERVGIKSQSADVLAGELFVPRILDEKDDLGGCGHQAHPRAISSEGWSFPLWPGSNFAART